MASPWSVTLASLPSAWTAARRQGGSLLAHGDICLLRPALASLPSVFVLALRAAEECHAGGLRGQGSSAAHQLWQLPVLWRARDRARWRAPGLLWLPCPVAQHTVRKLWSKLLAQGTVEPSASSKKISRLAAGVKLDIGYRLL